MRFSTTKIVSLFILLTCHLDIVFADDIAKLYSSTGKVEGKIDSLWKPISAGQVFTGTDSVKTAENSTAGIKFQDGFLLRLKEKTQIEFSKAAARQPINIVSGASYFFSRQPERFPEIKTPQVSASVRGTEFVVEVTGDETKISVLQGAVHAYNQFGEVNLAKGEQAITKNNSAPVKSILVNPLDAVQWSLYFPAIFSMDDFPAFETTAKPEGIEALKENRFRVAKSHFIGSSWTDAMGRSLALYYEGRGSEALLEVRNVENDILDLQLYKSALFLSLGDVTNAAAILGKVKDREKSASVLAQLAIVDLVLNRKDQARDKINEAFKLNRNSTSALLVSSFVHQSYFDLDRAEIDIKKILEINPNDLNAKVRYAEILLGLGEIEKASAIVEDVLSFQKNNEKALTVLGYILLGTSETDEAISHFNSAIGANDTYAAAHLGKGLALIRKGDLGTGRSEIEIATHLAPNISLYRSYLGKAFFEEKKENLSENEYDQAIVLDPNDPTPYLYRSFLKLSQHKPIDALADIESSIERNDNRAVYRSKLMLDKDEAVRGTSLGKIYNRIGFNELARVEAIKSINKDYSNYSAHFLLADLYQNSNLNSNAQTTENLIGRLLVPVNFNSNAVDLVGSQTSINEYTSLFSRPISRSRVLSVGDTATKSIGGGLDQTITDENYGVRIGYLGESKDGFRENDFQRQNQIYTQGQYQLFENDTIVWDATAVKNNQGDVVVGTDPYLENTGLNTSLDSGLVRGGYHHSFNLNSHLIAQAFYNKGHFKKTNFNEGNRISGVNITNNGILQNSNPFSFDGTTAEFIRTETDLFRGDLQHIYDSEYLSLVSGVSIKNERFNNRERGYIADVGSRDILTFLNGYNYTSAANVNDNSERAYLYSKIKPLDSLTFDVGLSYTHLSLAENPDLAPFTSEVVNKEAWDPKFGLVYQVVENLSLRASFTKSLGRTERGGIGPIEPTFVGGFSQLIDGVRGSAQDLYALGIDAKNPSTRTYFGTSYQNRKISLNRPFSTSNLSLTSGTLATTTTLQDGVFSSDGDEDRVSSYLYQILGSRVSLIGNHDWENFSQGVSQPDFDTNRFVLTLRYFDPSGFFAFGKNSWRDQRISGLGVDSTSDNFSISDVGLGYEFDSFHGFTSFEFVNIFDQDFRYSAIRDEAFLLPKFGAVMKFSYNF